MKLAPSMHKTVKWVIGLLVFFLFLFILLYFLLGPIVKSRLIEQVSIQTAGAYSLSIKNLEFNILFGNITAQSISFKPDTARILQDKLHEDLYEITAPEISLSGLNLWALLLDNRLSVYKLDIIRPKVRWVRNFDENDEVPATSEDITMDAEIPPVKIDNINLNELSLLIASKEKNSAMLSFEKASLRVENFLLKADSTISMEQKINFDDITFFVEDYTMKLPDSLNTLHFDSLKASIKHSTLIINGASMQPRFGSREYSQKKGEETDRIELYNKEIYVKGLDFRALKENSQFIANLIVIDSINMMVYRDKTYPIKSTEKVKLIQEQIRETSFYLRIDSLQLNDAQITYREKVEEGVDPGHLNFVNLNASISNITNDIVLLNNGATMKAQAATHLMGVGKITGYFNFPLANKSNAHTFYGTVSAMPLEIINPMLRYVAFVEVKSGKLNSLSFEAQLNENTSTGSMIFKYEDFKVEVLDKNKEKGVKGLVSFLANAFVIKSNNPANGELREGAMAFSRDKNKSIINYWWKTLLSGLKDTIGIPAKTENEK